MKEKQLPRQVALNLEVKRLAAERADLIASLGDWPQAHRGHDHGRIVGNPHRNLTRRANYFV